MQREGWRQDFDGPFRYHSLYQQITDQYGRCICYIPNDRGTTLESILEREEIGKIIVTALNTAWLKESAGDLKNESS